MAAPLADCWRASLNCCPNQKRCRLKTQVCADRSLKPKVSRSSKGKYMQVHILHALLLTPRFSGVRACERQSNRFSGFSTRFDYQKREKPLKRSTHLRSAFT